MLSEVSCQMHVHQSHNINATWCAEGFGQVGASVWNVVSPGTETDVEISDKESVEFACASVSECVFGYSRQLTSTTAEWDFLLCDDVIVVLEESHWTTKSWKNTQGDGWRRDFHTSTCVKIAALQPRRAVITAVVEKFVLVECWDCPRHLYEWEFGSIENSPNDTLKPRNWARSVFFSQLCCDTSYELFCSRVVNKANCLAKTETITTSAAATTTPPWTGLVVAMGAQ